MCANVQVPSRWVTTAKLDQVSDADTTFFISFGKKSNRNPCLGSGGGGYSDIFVYTTCVNKECVKRYYVFAVECVTYVLHSEL